MKGMGMKGMGMGGCAKALRKEQRVFARTMKMLVKGVNKLEKEGPVRRLPADVGTEVSADVGTETGEMNAPMDGNRRLFGLGLKSGTQCINLAVCLATCESHQVKMDFSIEIQLGVSIKVPI